MSEKVPIGMRSKKWGYIENNECIRIAIKNLKGQEENKEERYMKGWYGTDAHWYPESPGELPVISEGNSLILPDRNLAYGLPLSGP